MTLNMPKWPQMNWKQTKIGQTFLKSLAVLHVSVRHVTNMKKAVWEIAKNTKKSLLWLIFMTLLSHALWNHIIYAPNYMPNDISHKVT